MDARVGAAAVRRDRLLASVRQYSAKYQLTFSHLTGAEAAMMWQEQASRRERQVVDLTSPAYLEFEN